MSGEWLSADFVECRERLLGWEVAGCCSAFSISRERDFSRSREVEFGELFEDEGVDIVIMMRRWWK